MPRKTIKQLELEHSVQLLNQETEKTLRLEKTLTVSTQKIKEIELENLQFRDRIFNIEKEKSRLTGRSQEILAAHDILLRASLHASGMSWDDIEHMILESRRPFLRTGSEFSHHDAEMRPGNIGLF